jgi:hypothetical protein
MKKGAPPHRRPPVHQDKATMPQDQPQQQGDRPEGLPFFPPSLIPPCVPTTRSPEEVWHAESYLIACLTRHHGWHCTAPGRLEKWRTAEIRPVPAPPRSEAA